LYIEEYEKEIIRLTEDHQKAVEVLGPLEAAWLKAHNDFERVTEIRVKLEVNLLMPFWFYGRQTPAYWHWKFHGGLVPVLEGGNKDDPSWGAAVEWLDKLHESVHADKEPSQVEWKEMWDRRRNDASPEFVPSGQAVRAAESFTVTDKVERNLRARPTRESVPLNSDVKAPQESKKLPWTKI
jgi:hypothetical protein